MRQFIKQRWSREVGDMKQYLSETGLHHKISINDLEKLALFEITYFLKKIYSKLGTRYQLKPIYPKYVRISRKYLFNLYSWRIKLNSDEEIKKGNVGEIVIRSSWAFSKKMRKKAAAFLAADWYLYYLYANEGKIDTIRRFRDEFRRKPTLIAHILKLIGEEKWIYVNEKSIEEHGKFEKKIDGDLVKYLQITEGEIVKIETVLRDEITNLEKDLGVKAIDELITKKKIDLTIIEKTDILIKTEIKELGYLIQLLKKEVQLRQGEEKTDLNNDIAVLRGILKALIGIYKNIEKWVHIEKKEHNELGKQEITAERLRNELAAELREITIDIRKIHILLEEFDYEKSVIINKIANLNIHLVN